MQVHFRISLSMYLWNSFGIALICMYMIHEVSGWKKDIDYDKLEKEWTRGDMQEELTTEGDVMYKRAQEEAKY